MFIPPPVQKWVLLNLFRLLTLISCCLVIASNIKILKQNFDNAHNEVSSTDSYVPQTDIPTHVWGDCWSFLHHFSTLITLFLLFLSEFPFPGTWTNKSIGGLLQKFFSKLIPFLGKDSSNGISGCVMISTGADGLSRKIGGDLALVGNWLLVSVGLVNILLSLIFRSKLKTQRSLLFFKNPEILSQSLPLPNTVSTKIVEKGGKFFSPDSRQDCDGFFTKVQIPGRSMGGEASSYKSKAKDFYFSGNGNQSQNSMVSVHDEEKFHYSSPSTVHSGGYGHGIGTVRSNIPPSIKTTAPSDYSYHPYLDDHDEDGVSEVRSNHTGGSTVFKNQIPKDKGSQKGFLNLPPAQPFRRNPSSAAGSSVPDSESYYGEGLDAVSLPSRVPFRLNNDSNSRCGSPFSGVRSQVDQSVSQSGRSASRNGSRNEQRLKRNASKSTVQTSKSGKSSRRIPPPPISTSSSQDQDQDQDLDSDASESRLDLNESATNWVLPAERSPGLVASWRAAALEARIKAQAVKDQQRRSLKLGKKFGLNDRGQKRAEEENRKAFVEDVDEEDEDWDGTTLREMEQVGNERVVGKRGRKLEMIQRRD